jgi:hypothetical protein
MRKETMTLLNAVTSNQTSAPFRLPAGRKWIQASIEGTGAVSAVITFYGNTSFANTGGVPLTNAFTISGTTSATDGADIPGEPAFGYCTVASISGTGAAVTCRVSV